MSTFDKFDVCEAYYVFAMLHHGGQFSTEYEVFSRLDRIGFRPRPSLNDECDLSENGLGIYQRLVSGERSVRPRGAQ